MDTITTLLIILGFGLAFLGIWNGAEYIGAWLNAPKPVKPHDFQSSVQQASQESLIRIAANYRAKKQLSGNMRSSIHEQAQAMKQLPSYRSSLDFELEALLAPTDSGFDEMFKLLRKGVAEPDFTSFISRPAKHWYKNYFRNLDTD